MCLEVNCFKYGLVDCYFVEEGVYYCGCVDIFCCWFGKDFWVRFDYVFVFMVVGLFFWVVRCVDVKGLCVVDGVLRGDNYGNSIIDS